MQIAQSLEAASKKSEAAGTGSVNCIGYTKPVSRDQLNHKAKSAIAVEIEIIWPQLVHSLMNFVRNATRRDT